uniref:Uncharacterized protein n=1 Tax=Anguilla anguilla TaxID=7936 RepID=A0A0E9SCW1_ANGAN
MKTSADTFPLNHPHLSPATQQTCR